MKQKIRPFGIGFVAYYILIILNLIGLIIAYFEFGLFSIQIILLIISLIIFIIEAKDTFLILEPEQITLSRRFRKNNKVRIRKETLQLKDISQVAYGDEIKKSRREQTYSGRYSGYTPKEILFKVDKKYIPIDSKAYSKKNLKTLLEYLKKESHIEIFGSLNEKI